MDFVDTELLYSTLNSSLLNSSLLGFNTSLFGFNTSLDLSRVLENSRHLFILFFPLFFSLLTLSVFYFPLKKKMNEVVERVNELTDEVEHLEDCLNEENEENEESEESGENGEERRIS